jgi:hypothetical protein
MKDKDKLSEEQKKAIDLAIEQFWAGRNYSTRSCHG